MSLKSIKAKIKATDRTRKVTKAMEAVSAVKMRKSQERALGGRAYARSALRILSRVSGIGSLKNALTESRSGNKTLIILVTSDKGLAGSLNTAVIKEAERIAATLPKDELIFICLGKRGYEFFEKRGYTIHSYVINQSDDVSLSDMRSVTDEATRLFLSKVVDRVVVVYQNFRSTFEQQPVVRTVLPLNANDLTEIVNGIAGKGSEVVEDTRVSGYTVEPGEEAVLSELLPRLGNVIVYHALLEAKASEHSARMVAMKNASDKAKDVSRFLNLKYNKARQAAITREVSEITGGIEAMRN